MTIFDIAPLSEWRQHRSAAKYAIDSNLSPSLMRSILHNDLLTMVCQQQRDKIVELEREIKGLRGEHDME